MDHTPPDDGDNERAEQPDASPHGPEPAPPTASPPPAPPHPPTPPASSVPAAAPLPPPVVPADPPTEAMAVPPTGAESEVVEAEAAATELPRTDGIAAEPAIGVRAPEAGEPSPPGAPPPPPTLPTASAPAEAPEPSAAPSVFSADDYAGLTGRELQQQENVADRAEGAELAPPAPAITPKAKKSSTASFFKELPILILIAFGLALLIKTFLLQAFYIPSESMTPTLEVGDRVLVNKLVYRFHPPRRGDIIVFIESEGPRKSFGQRVRSFFTEGLGVTKPATRDFIKRVIGLPGETVSMKDGIVTITTKAGKQITIDETKYVIEKDLTPFGPHTIAPGRYFVMGDNRTHSADSRSLLGDIKKKDIVGRAAIRIWPFKRFTFFRRPKYGQAGALAFLLVTPPVTRRRRAA